MTNFLKNKGSFVALAMLCGGLVTAACSNEEATNPGDVAGDADENSGSLGLNLTLSNGAVINTVEATIEGDALSAPIVRTINIPNEGATVSALFGGLPEGDYTVSLAAESEDGATTCGGSADFSVLAGQTVGVTVPLTCSSDVVRGSVGVNGEINICPAIDALFVAPLQTAVGGEITVEASAADADEDDTISYAWSATDGTFADASAQNTVYTCDASGEQTLTITINDGGDCSDSTDIVINCEPTAVCGDGIVEEDKGEDCDPPEPGVCADNCTDIEAVCGDGFINQPSEECEPAGTDTCNDDCEIIECGDGAIEGPETCEPPSTQFCDAECNSIPGCGNGIVEGDEGCDPPQEGVCDEVCQPIAGCSECQAEFCPGPLGDQETQCAGGACADYLTCLEDTGCAGGDDPDVRRCYCGTTDFTTCFNSFSTVTGNGDCLAQTEALAGSTVPLQIGTLYFDTSVPLGAANQVQLCTANNCSGVCY